MRLLILGGTVFLGRHLVAAAVDLGHEVSVFHRGKHYPGLFPDAETLVGDRRGDLSALGGRTWDAVIDTSGNSPDAVAASAAALSGAVERYAFVSTLAVYLGFPRVPRLDESAPIIPAADAAAVTPSPAAIGALKALCEHALAEAIGDRALVVRAGLLAGPHDPTDRFTYWPRRIAQGGEVLAPRGPGMRVQMVDARDLAVWILASVEAGRTGAWNATGPAAELTMGDLVDTCRVATSSDATFTWVDEDFLLKAGVQPRMELPLWMPDSPGAATVDASRAIAAGLTFRPLADTVRDTLKWDEARPAEAPRRAGIAPDREAEVLTAWRAHLQRTDPEPSQHMLLRGR